MVAIEIHGLSKRFGDVAAVDDLSFLPTPERRLRAAARTCSRSVIGSPFPKE